MIELIALKTGGSIRKVCAVLGEARSSFYHAATPTATQGADVRLGDLIETVFRRHRKRYGYRRLAQELSDRGVICATARIRRLMAQRALRAIQPKNFIPKTSDGRADKPSPNLLSGQPLPAAPDQAWAGDDHLHPDQFGLALPGRRHRSLLAPHRGLEPRRSPALRSRPRRPAPSPPNAPSPSPHLPQ